jgi:hypothetical protein
MINFAEWVLPLATGILITGVILVIFSSNDISEALVRRSWPTTMAVVVDATITGERAYNPQINCEYKVEGKDYTLISNLKTPGFGRKRSRHQTSEIILNEYPVGSNVRIRYNPNNPGEAYIRTGPYWSDYMKISLGTLLLILGLYGVVVMSIKKFS